MNEDVVAEAPKAGTTAARQAAAARQEGVTTLTAKRLSEISTTEEKSRILTGISELDRVLGGGIVLGGVVLLSGEPGVGKSTMLLQLCGAISNQHTVLYITGEESVRQVKLRAARLKVPQENIFLAAENDVDEICGLIEKEKPDLVVIDSIQTMRCMDIASSSGTVSQVKESAARLLAVAKKQEIPMFIVGHVNKDGAIAGPKVMEHIVDTVLYFEGDKMLPYRILRAAKNRYGSTNELGMFDMTGQGLAEIENPSQMLLEGRPLGVSGNCVACTIEGSRPILSEIQALATKTNFPAPRRACSGYDYNRMNLLIAVLEKRAGHRPQRSRPEKPPPAFHCPERPAQHPVGQGRALPGPLHALPAALCRVLLVGPHFRMYLHRMPGPAAAIVLPHPVQCDLQGGHPVHRSTSFVPLPSAEMFFRVAAHTKEAAQTAAQNDRCKAHPCRAFHKHAGRQRQHEQQRRKPEPLCDAAEKTALPFAERRHPSAAKAAKPHRHRSQRHGRRAGTMV